jgi:2Fe-2S iron-sulfur cluster binding domain
VSKDSRFRRLPEAGADEPPLIHFTWNGQTMAACANETLAAALLANDVIEFGRETEPARTRTPFCMMGSCFECRVAVNGVANVQACMIRVSEGLAAATNSGRFDPGPPASNGDEAARDGD